MRRRSRRSSRSACTIAPRIAASGFLRTIDMAACARFPLGTHFFWHLLNGVVLYRAVRSLLQRPH
jgi:hypothetical protein